MCNDAVSRAIWGGTLLLSGLGATACALLAGGAVDPLDNSSRAWARIYSDDQYVIALDTAHLGFETRTPNTVWYRTDHALMFHRDGKLWNREVSQSVLLCTRMAYKVAAVDMSLGAGVPVAQQRTPERELAREPWRRIERGTVEEIAALAACDRIRRRGVALEARRRAEAARATQP